MIIVAFFIGAAERATVPNRSLSILAATAVTMVTTAMICLPATTAAPPETTTADFYVPPTPLPAGPPGTIIRSQPYKLAISVPERNGRIPANATRLMYLSTDTHGAPNAVTGTYLATTLPWKGPGPRPLVAYAVGTHGQGDHCAPSKLLQEFVTYRPPVDVLPEYEIVGIYDLLAHGMSVVVTDYYGLGTPPIHDYVNRLSQAHAVLDSLRAAQRLPGSDIRQDTPLALFGYSQGGGASAAAAELQANYAPELNVRGAYAGAPPANLLEVLNSPGLNGGPIGNGRPGGAAIGLIGYVINGVYADYPESRSVIDQTVNLKGAKFLKDVAQQCVGATILNYAYDDSRAFIANGQSISTVINSSPVLKGIAEEQTIGTLKPQAPVLLVSNINDDLVPHQQVRQLAEQWCTQGATVKLDTALLPPLIPSTIIGHGIELIPGIDAGEDWISDRFAGKPAPNSCGSMS
ncbi:MAG: alpha/beta fold hydrolase [Mycobacterium sp.]|nr:alpha/beta fold hydrolase [Mycobacterium sp.]